MTNTDRKWIPDKENLFSVMDLFYGEMIYWIHKIPNRIFDTLTTYHLRQIISNALLKEVSSIKYE